MCLSLCRPASARGVPARVHGRVSALCGGRAHRLRGPDARPQSASAGVPPPAAAEGQPGPGRARDPRTPRPAAERHQGHLQIRRQVRHVTSRHPLHVLTCAYMSLHVHTCPYMCIHVLTCVYMSLHALTCPHMCIHVLTWCMFTNAHRFLGSF